VLDKKIVGLGFSLFFAVSFGCFLIYYWSLLKMLFHNNMHYLIPF